MTAFSRTIAADSDFARADQRAFVRDAGLDLTTVRPSDDRMRTAIEAAEISDRIGQAWITPLDLDDDYDYDPARLTAAAR
ncbi:hypothetical protein [Nocardia stercoris]|uniref:Uncharacterized protein n=1 Tax=Nocardia stercoris TaxID=2483361 RepID=A0A3M2L1H6_9NOCA|nr:hypothetical protein [Nocardia stercoris]RMI31234.1 hypothetical protein EBN03_17830 [Nocardia stercoris]